MDYRTLQATGNVNATVAFREPLNLVTKKLTTVNKASLTGELNGEIASRSRSMDFWAMGAMLPNPDDVLKKLGLDIRVYESLKKDASVGGAIRRRKSAVKAMERGFRDDSNPKVNELLDSVFEKLDLSTIIDNILEAPLFGYQPLEVLWNSQTWLPTDVVEKPQHWFGFDDDNQLRLKSRDNMLHGEILPSRKFLLPRQGATYINPYGFADLSMCYWAVVFKKGGLKFWVTFAEKYGTPWLIGKHPRGSTPNEIDKLLDSLDMLFGDAVGVIPDDNSVEIKEAVGKTATVDVFERLIVMCKAEINIALLGQNQTTEATANLASAKAGLQVTEDIRDDDAKLVGQTLTQLARWIVDIHFGEDVPCPPFELWEQQEVDDKQAKRDKELKGAGANFSNQYFTREYGLEEGDLLPQAMPSPSSVPNFAQMQFSEPMPLSHKWEDWADIVGQQLSNQANPTIIDWLKRIKILLNQHIAKGSDMNDFAHALTLEFGELTSDELVKVMELGLLAGELAGRAEVVNETGIGYAQN